LGLGLGRSPRQGLGDLRLAATRPADDDRPRIDPELQQVPAGETNGSLGGGGEPIAQLVRLLLDRGAPQGPRLELRLGEVLLALQSGGLGEQRPESRVVVGELRDVGEVQRRVIEKRRELPGTS